MNDPFIKTDRFFELVCAFGQNEVTPADQRDLDQWIDGSQERQTIFDQEMKIFNSVDLVAGRARIRELMSKLRS